MPAIRKLREEIDWTLVLTVGLLALVGVVNLRSASLGGESSAYVAQIVWLVLGGVFAALLAAIDYRHFERFAEVFYLGCIAMLVLVLVLSREVNGSARWLGVWEFGIQPSEITKIAVILSVSKFFAGTRRPEGYSLKDLTSPLALVGVPAFLIMLEPDLGSAVVVLLIFGTLLFFERIRRKAWVVMLSVTAVSVPMMWFFGMHDYQRERVLSFLDPERSKFGSGWHARQSIIAVGSGGFTGKGYMRSTQTWGRFLPETRTDFVLATYAEEHGFLGVLFLMGLYFFLIAWALHIASTSKDRFGALISVGVTALVFWQVLANVGMVLGIMPVVGVTLPLMSYGGSSVLTIMLGIGLLLSVSTRRHIY